MTGQASPGRCGLTIVVPAYNEEASLAVVVADTVRAAEATLDAWEVVIVDDASTDGTLEVARTLAEEHAGVRFVPTASSTSRRSAPSCVPWRGTTS